MAQKSDTEEDLRIGVEKALAPVLRDLGITTHPRYERATNTAFYGGSTDSVYGHLIIEYERPGKLSTKSGQAGTVQQLIKYLNAEASRYGEKQKETALRRMIGVSLDGFQILFVRYTGTKARAKVPFPERKPSAQPALLPEAILPGGFDLDGPNPVNAQTISLFLTYIRALRRYPLTPEDLTKEFGPDAETARQAVNAFYQTLLASKSPKVDTFFKEWDRIFGIVYGQDIGKAQKDATQLAKGYGVDMRAELKPLLFAVHTYYALLMKLLVAELLSLQPESYVPSFVTQLAGLSDAELQRQLSHLEDGGHFQAFGIQNFLEGDFFGWYLADWNEDISAATRRMALRLSDFEPATAEIDPEATRDLLKKLYQYLVPKKLRHDLGEYYTPDWLAERLLNQVGYDGNPELRLLDPACGSGTFLALAIKRIRQYADEKLLDYADVAKKVLKNVVGFDLNPVAVIAARTTYLLALGNLRRAVSPITIPVYMCDSILTPRERLEPGLFEQGPVITTVAGTFMMPREIIAKRQMDALSQLLEECVKSEYAEKEFLERAERELGFEEGATRIGLSSIYQTLLRLEKEGRNRIWARILKNAFAPVFQEPFDYVVGNPPWVNWESLSDEYREATKPLWEDYGLFSLKGWRARLGGGKKDLAALFAYACIDNYLKDKGKLGFVITQTLFKTMGAGDGFRRFKLGEDGADLRVFHVDDMVALKPFEGAANRTSVFVVQRGAPTKYPVPYTLWTRKRGASIGMDVTLEEAQAVTARSNLVAIPVERAEPTSPWITARTGSLRAIDKCLGKAAYRARKGAYSSPNGVYWLQILERLEDGTLVIENLCDVGRKDIEKVRTAIEADLVYPLLRGRDVSSWNTRPSAYILLAQDPEKRVGYPEGFVKLELPKTFAYFKRFEDSLRASATFQKYYDPIEDPFYSMFNVGPYTLAAHKVLFREQAKHFGAAAVEPIRDPYLGTKTLIPNHKLVLIACKSHGEAHYVCAVLNCAIAKLVVQTYVVPTAVSTHVLEHIAVPKYNSQNSLHRELSALSQRAHELAAKGEKKALKEIEEEIDRKAAELWGISKSELAEIKRSLAELS